MQWFSDLRIFSKLLLMNVITICFLLGVGAMGYVSMQNMYGNAREMYNDRLLPVKWLNQAHIRWQTVQNDILQMCVLEDKGAEQRLQEDIGKQAKAFDELLTSYENTKLDLFEKEKMQIFREKLKAYREERAKVVNMATSGQKKEAFQYFQNGLAPRIAECTELLAQLSDYNSDKAKGLSDEVEQRFQKAVWITLGSVVGATLLALFIGMTIARRIVNPIRRLQELMEKAGEGDLRVRTVVESSDEVGQLTQSFNQMIQHQEETVKLVQRSSVDLASSSEEMAASAEQVTSATQDIANNMMDVVQRAAQGDEAVMETSKALLQLSSLIQIAKSQADVSAHNSAMMKSASTEGQETVADTVARMTVIREKTVETEELIVMLSQYSDQIGIITDTITNLASQTNLLALNAAIEAARAGEAGRGFAVVAEEVRKLAEQSNQGAAEVSTLVRKISDSTAAAVTAMQAGKAEVEAGVMAVNRSGDALRRIRETADEMVKAVEEILQITGDEVATSERIVRLIDELAVVIERANDRAKDVAAATEEISATTETVAASAEESSAMAHSLQTMVERFKLSK